MSLAVLFTPLANSRSPQEPPKAGNPQSGEQRPKDLKEKQEAPRGKTSIRVSVEQVSVDVTVMDKNGGLIQGLAPENFKIYEDRETHEFVLNMARIQEKGNISGNPLYEYRMQIQ